MASTRRAKCWVADLGAGWVADWAADLVAVIGAVISTVDDPAGVPGAVGGALHAGFAATATLVPSATANCMAAHRKCLCCMGGRLRVLCMKAARRIRTRSALSVGNRGRFDALNSQDLTSHFSRPAVSPCEQTAYNAPSKVRRTSPGLESRIQGCCQAATGAGRHGGVELPPPQTRAHRLLKEDDMKQTDLPGLDTESEERSGRTDAHLGASDSSDSVSDLARSDLMDDGDPYAPVDVALRDDAMRSSTSANSDGSAIRDAAGTGESRSAAGDAGEEAADVGVDRVFTPSRPQGGDLDEHEDQGLAFLDRPHGSDLKPSRGLQDEGDNIPGAEPDDGGAPVHPDPMGPVGPDGPEEPEVPVGDEEQEDPRTISDPPVR